MIRPALPTDAPAIAAIYNHYVDRTPVTFEEAPVAAAEMANRMTEVLAMLPWLVFERDGRVVGYAYASRWRTRSAYRFAVESTIYLEAASTGMGIGAQLYGRLLAELQERSIHTVIGGITLPNAASVALHESLGFKKVAHFEQVGWKFERWLDVGYWQRIL
jgi:phosphinothricin acetyltransferase